MFRCIGILFVSFVISLALSPIGPFSLLTWGDRFSSQPNSEGLDWCLHLYRGSKILVERKVAQPTISDTTKIFLQSCTSKPIIWWPLVNPLLPLSAGQVRISRLSVSQLSWWTSTTHTHYIQDSFEDLSIDVPREVADRFEKCLKSQKVWDN
jgi:hypothetical protein